MLVHSPFPFRWRGGPGRPRAGLNARGTIAAHPPVAGDAAEVQAAEVQVVLPADHDRTNLRDRAFSFALDQRAFGARRVLTGVADRDGQFRGLAHVGRPDPPELALAPCLEALRFEIRRGAHAAVVWCDEPVTDGPPPPDLADRFEACRAHADQYGVRLVDWFACDDLFMRSTQLAVDPEGGWWELG